MLLAKLPSPIYPIHKQRATEVHKGLKLILLNRISLKLGIKPIIVSMQKCKRKLMQLRPSHTVNKFLISATTYSPDIALTQGAK